MIFTQDFSQDIDERMFDFTTVFIDVHFLPLHSIKYLGRKLLLLMDENAFQFSLSMDNFFRNKISSRILTFRSIFKN